MGVGASMNLRKGTQFSPNYSLSSPCISYSFPVCTTNRGRGDLRKQDHLYLSEAGVNLRHTPHAWQSINLIPFREKVCHFLEDVSDMVATLSSCSALTAPSSNPKNSRADLHSLPAEGSRQTTHLHRYEWLPDQLDVGHYVHWKLSCFLLLPFFWIPKSGRTVQSQCSTKITFAPAVRT